MVTIINILDARGVRTGTVNGVAVAGMARAITNLVYNPRGASLSKSGQLTVSFPMTVRKNLAIQAGRTILEVIDASPGVGNCGWFCVDDKSETVSTDGHTATFTCRDLMSELANQMVPGLSNVPGEDVPALVNRLVAIPAINGEPAWGATCAISGFPGVGFTTPPQSVQAAIDKLTQERFGYYRLGSNPDGSGTPWRTVEVGNFGQVSGLRLVRPPSIPGKSNPPSYIRYIEQIGVQSDAKRMVNCLAPSGTGVGALGLDLAAAFRGQTVSWNATIIPGWSVAGNIGFAGYNPAAYPIYRRITYDGVGYQYFLIDAAIVTTVPPLVPPRQRWGLFAKADIAVGGTGTAADFSAAGQALYAAAVAELRWTVVPTVQLTLTTRGIGDVRGLAGQTVMVEWPEFVGGTQILQLNGANGYSGTYTVLDVSRAVNDDTGVRTDTWTLSSTGRKIQDEIARLSSQAGAIDSVRLVPTIYPNRITYMREGLVDSTHSLSMPWDADPSIGQVDEATFIVSLLPACGDVTSISGDGTHLHTGTLPSVPVTASIAQIAPTAPASQFGHGHAAGTAGQGAHNHTGTGGAATGNTSLSGSATGSHTHNGTNNYLNGDTNNGTGGGSSQFSHAHGSSTAADKTGAVGNGDLTITGGGLVNNSGLVPHQHKFDVGAQGGAANNYVSFGGNAGSNYLYAAGAIGAVSTGYISNSQDTNHGHGSSTAADKTGNVGNGDLAITGGGKVSNTALAFNPKVGVYTDGSITPSVGILGHIGFGPTVGGDTGTDPGGGFTPGVDTHGGFTPLINAINNIGITGATTTTVIPTNTPAFAGTGGHAHTATHGKWVDPNYTGNTISVWVNNVQVGGAYTTDFSVDLAAQLPPNGAANVEFRAASFGRLLIRERVRIRISPTKI